MEPGGDCDDRDPTWSPAAVTLAEGATCVDVESVDRDADGVTPPTDPDDQDGTRWGQERDCRDGTDDDHDGLLDCEDGDCADLPLCAESNCEDGLDGDRDGDVDCADEDCWQDETCTSVLAWVVTGQVEARFAPILGSILSAEDIQGRVRLGDPHGVRSCTWSVDAARRSSATGWYTWRTRHGFTITPGCDVGSSVLPDVPGIPQRHGRGSPRDWYYPLRPLGQQGPYLMYSGGPAFSSDPHGHCLPGETHVLGFPDTDGDGFGVSDPFDLHGALGGRRFACGSLPAGWVATGGDCDDTDRTWTPTRVRVRQGAACADLAPDDRDGDGVRAPADPNDNDATVP